MDLTALPTQLPQSSNTTDAHSDHAYDTMRNHTAVNETLEDSAPSTLSSIEPNAIILAEALTDKTISWRIHTFLISKKIMTQDVPLPFLYHYDSLDDSIIQTYSLTLALLPQFHTTITAIESAKLIGI